MIIPIRCFSCNNVIGDLWNYYQKKLKQRRGTSNPEDRFYMDGKQIPQTLELEILTELGIKRPCCRAKFLTHVPLIDKII
jgi:DNA-directed RNA polymerase subunit N (RpoN/RPB10)